MPEPGAGVNLGRAVRGTLLLGLAAMIGVLLASGRMSMYMSPAMDLLSALTGALLGLLGAVELFGPAHDVPQHAHVRGPDALLTYVLVGLPVALGLFYVPRALDAAALGGQAPSSYVLAFSSTRPDAAQSTREPLPDIQSLFRFLRTAGEAGVGQPVQVLGMVAGDSSLADGEFVLLRYAVVHCVADAQPVGLLVLASEASRPPRASWVVVDGTLESSPRSGTHLVSVRATHIQPAEEPTSPYLQAF
jgi:uncharacterized repeat protein (TIGR03943 family)